MRLAILSDIHGNTIALDAVLDDIQGHGGVDEYLVLGDLVAQGYDPAGVLDRLAALPRAYFVRGNTDRYTLMGQRAWPSEAEAQANPALVPAIVAISQGFAWTHGYLAATGWLDWLSALPLEQRLTLPGGTRLLGVHAAPGHDDGPGFTPMLGEEEVQKIVHGCDAELICVGHTHWDHEHRVGTVHVVNVGCVSNPRSEALDPRASYALLEASLTEYHITIHHCAYDLLAVIEAIRQSHFFPNPEWLAAKFAAHLSTPT